jgi:hypothetical protein
MMDPDCRKRVLTVTGGRAVNEFCGLTSAASCHGGSSGFSSIFCAEILRLTDRSVNGFAVPLLPAE